MEDKEIQEKIKLNPTKKAQNENASFGLSVFFILLALVILVLGNLINFAKYDKDKKKLNN